MSAMGKNWVFTVNNYTEEDCANVLAWYPSEAKYVAYSREVAPTTGMRHLQGFVVWNNNKRMSGCKVRHPTAYFALMKGSLRQSEVYCSKSASLEEAGELPMTRKEIGAAQKEKWADVIRSAKEGTCEVEYPREFLQYNNTVKRLYAPALSELEMYSGVWYVGPPGSGKSRHARDMYPGAYDKLLNKWWDGYENEDYVLIDDIGLEHAHMGSFLKRYVDHYPFRAEYKGGSKVIRPKVIIVTSNYEMSEIWHDKPQDLAALQRRFKVTHFTDFFQSKQK